MAEPKDKTGRGRVGANIGEVSVEDSAFQSVNELQYSAGFRFEWDLFQGFERRNKVKLAESRQSEAEDELQHAKEKTVRQVWKAYNDAGTQQKNATSVKAPHFVDYVVQQMSGD